MKELEDLARRQADPIYSEQCRKPDPANAFIYPANPEAAFPQKMKARKIDYRSSAVEEAKTAGRVAFRKAGKGKYSAKVWTAEQLKEQEMNEITNLMEEKLDTNIEQDLNANEEMSEEENVEDQMEKLALGPKRKDVQMGLAKKPIQKKKKKSRRYNIFRF